MPSINVPTTCTQHYFQPFPIFLLRIYSPTTKDMWITFIHHTLKPYTYKHLFIKFVIYFTQRHLYGLSLIAYSILALNGQSNSKYEIPNQIIYSSYYNANDTRFITNLDISKFTRNSIGYQNDFDKLVNSDCFSRLYLHVTVIF